MANKQPERYLVIDGVGGSGLSEIEAALSKEGYVTTRPKKPMDYDSIPGVVTEPLGESPQAYLIQVNDVFGSRLMERLMNKDPDARRFLEPFTDVESYNWMGGESDGAMGPLVIKRGGQYAGAFEQP